MSDKDPAFGQMKRIALHDALLIEVVLVYALSPELFLLGFFSPELEGVLWLDLVDVFSDDDFSPEDLAESELLEEPSAAADFL